MPDARHARGSAGPAFAPGERRALGGYAAAVALLHVVGWGLCLFYTRGHPSLLGLGLAAYLFGLRHAFDADHIAAIDDSVRLMLQRAPGGRRPLGVGFFFSLGHSSVVFALALLSALLASTLQRRLPGLQGFGGVFGTLVSAAFLWLVGLLNLGVLLDMLRVWRRRRHAHQHAQWEQLLQRRGLLSRLLGGRLTRCVRHSWQMYPVGLLFGLGFDTASEIALLALTGGAATHRLPLAAVVALPLLFTAGMSLFDTADGVAMTHAYGWALADPVRRIFYNITTTALSVGVALAIGSFELAQVLVGELGLHGWFAGLVAGMSSARLGYGVVALFLGAWALSWLAWRGRRWSAAAVAR